MACGPRWLDSSRPILSPLDRGNSPSCIEDGFLKPRTVSHLVVFRSTQMVCRRLFTVVGHWTRYFKQVWVGVSVPMDTWQIGLLFLVVCVISNPARRSEATARGFMAVDSVPPDHVVR